MSIRRALLYGSLVCAAALAPAVPAVAATNPCPPGATNSSYCVNAGTALGQTIVSQGVATMKALGVAGLAKNKGYTLVIKPTLSGSFRYVLRFNDLRPRMHNRSVVVFNLLTHVTIGKPVKVHVKLRPIGVAILRYARAHHTKVHVEIINHVRPVGATQSVQTLKFALQS